MKQRLRYVETEGGQSAQLEFHELHTAALVPRYVVSFVTTPRMTPVATYRGDSWTRATQEFRRLALLLLGHDAHRNVWIDAPEPRQKV